MRKLSEYHSRTVFKSEKVYTTLGNYVLHIYNVCIVMIKRNTSGQSPKSVYTSILNICMNKLQYSITIFFHVQQRKKL